MAMFVCLVGRHFPPRQRVPLSSYDQSWCTHRSMPCEQSPADDLTPEEDTRILDNNNNHYSAEEHTKWPQRPGVQTVRSCRHVPEMTSTTRSAKSTFLPAFSQKWPQPPGVQKVRFCRHFHSWKDWRRNVKTSVKFSRFTLTKTPWYPIIMGYKERIPIARPWQAKKNSGSFKNN